MAKPQQDSRFGFGQAVGALGAFVIAASVSQPFLRLDLGAAFTVALSGSTLPREATNNILYVGSRTSKSAIDTSPQVAALARSLGVQPTGLEQDRIAAIIVLVLALVALIAIVRSVLAATAWGARANAPFLAIAGFGGFAVAAAELWVRAPAPREAMRPDLGLWMLVGGGVLLLLGALTLGGNRRRPYLDDFGDGTGPRTFDGAEHLVYSNGAWVPRNPAGTER
jgi:hypothetical protein